jgi:pullulanase
MAQPEPLKGVRVWLDIGTEEGTNPVLAVEPCEQLSGALRKSGRVEGKDFIWRKVEGAGHNEPAWEARFGDVLTFLFGID